MFRQSVNIIAKCVWRISETAISVTDVGFAAIPISSMVRNILAIGGHLPRDLDLDLCLLFVCFSLLFVRFVTCICVVL